MKTRWFGKLGFEISSFGLGCMRLPQDQDGKADEAASIAMIRGAIDGGVSYIDTGYGYMGGQSERILGKALRDGYREKVHIATKLPPWLCNTPDDMERILTEQLKRLDIPTIDFYLVHSVYDENWPKMMDFGVLDFMQKQRKAGKIRYIGFSTHADTAYFKQVLDAFGWDMCQVQYNYMDTAYQAGVEGIRYAGSKGVPIVVMEGLRGGHLANVPPSVEAIFDAHPVKRSPAEWAFRWLATFPEIAVVLSGTSTEEQMRDNLRIFSADDFGAMSPEEFDVIEKARVAYMSRMKAGCTGCEYCLPCPQNVMIPKIFSLWNQAAMYGLLGQEDWHYREYADEGRGAAACVSCGRCQSMCPQSLRIPALLQQAHCDLLA